MSTPIIEYHTLPWGAFGPQRPRCPRVNRLVATGEDSDTFSASIGRRRGQGAKPSQVEPLASAEQRSHRRSGPQRPHRNFRRASLGAAPWLIAASLAAALTACLQADSPSRGKSDLPNPGASADPSAGATHETTADSTPNTTPEPSDGDPNRGDEAEDGSSPQAPIVAAPPPPPWPNIVDDTLCTDAVEHLAQQCDIPRWQIHYDGICDPYDACESACALGASCEIWGESPGSPPSNQAIADYDTCRLACYAHGPGTCRQAELHARACGIPVRSEWNSDRFCDATERCIANCALGTGCLGLAGVNPETAMWRDCQQDCAAAALREAPLTLPATFCGTYPQHTLCRTGSAPLPPRSYYCLFHPAAPTCANPTDYCAAHGEDPWCQSPVVTCQGDAAPSEAPRCEAPPTYCALRPNDPWCSPILDDAGEFCETYPDAPECLLGRESDVPGGGNPLCEIFPTAAECNTDALHPCVIETDDPACARGAFFWRYCEYYPDSPECNPSSTFCALYPQSPECDTTWLPYCDRYPDDPYCRDPDYHQRYCDFYPNSPECSSVYEPYCVRHPTDPDC